MTIENTYSLYLLMICNGMLAGAAAIAILRFQRMIKLQQTFWGSPTGAAISTQPVAPTQAAQPDQDDFLKAVERRFAYLEQGFGNLADKNQSGQSMQHSVPHENAVRMAKHGATIDDLTRTCGLSDIEARLLLRVHRQNQTSSRLN